MSCQSLCSGFAGWIDIVTNAGIHLPLECVRIFTIFASSHKLTWKRFITRLVYSRLREQPESGCVKPLCHSETFSFLSADIHYRPSVNTQPSLWRSSCILSHVILLSLTVTAHSTC